MTQLKEKTLITEFLGFYIKGEDSPKRGTRDRERELMNSVSVERKKELVWVWCNLISLIDSSTRSHLWICTHEDKLPKKRCTDGFAGRTQSGDDGEKIIAFSH